MDFQALFQQFLHGGVAEQASIFDSVSIFLPELVLSCTIVLMLVARLISLDRLIPTHWFAIFGGMTSFILVLQQFWKLSMNEAVATKIFTGLAVHD